jgi:hypothetical protein
MVKVVLGVREKKEREGGIYTTGFSPPAMSGTDGENLVLITEWFSPPVLTSTTLTLVITEWFSPPVLTFATLKLPVKMFHHQCLQNRR